MHCLIALKSLRNNRTNHFESPTKQIISSLYALGFWSSTKTYRCQYIRAKLNRNSFTTAFYLIKNTCLSHAQINYIAIVSLDSNNQIHRSSHGNPPDSQSTNLPSRQCLQVPQALRLLSVLPSPNAYSKLLNQEITRRVL